MFEILGLLFGGIGRLIPEVLKFFTARQEADHEFRMTQLQLQIDQARSAQRIDELHAQGEIAQNVAELQAMMTALQEQGRSSGVPFIDGLNSSVRPVLTYWWCVGIYTAHKALLMYVALTTKLPVVQMAPVLMNDFDRGVVGSIIGFWFVDRALRKMAP